MGATKLDDEQSFYWMGSNALFEFADWHEGEPNNYNPEEQCIEMKNQSGDWKWNDTMCRSKLHIACEERFDNEISQKSELRDLFLPFAG